MSEMAMTVVFAAARCDAKRHSHVLRGIGYLLSSLLLSALSARAEAPPSQEFWNYLLEYGDAQGEVFDPTDYASVANIPDKARAEFSHAQTSSTTEVMPAASSNAPAAWSNSKAAQEQPQ